MVIVVRVSAALAQELGAPRLPVTVADDATVAGLIAHLRAQYPHAARLALALPIVAGQYVGPEYPLAGVSEIALLLPVAGGAALSPSRRLP